MSGELLNIRDLNLEELTEELTLLGEKPFRAKQIYEWLWKKGALSIDEMTNLSLELRNKLHSRFFIDALRVSDEQVSKDRTIKCAFEIEKNKVVEGVLIPTSSRMTACISSQEKTDG